jgi:GNAT superfamily N-acetyltransferase
MAGVRGGATPCPAVAIQVADPFGAEARHCLEAYYRELATRFDEGFDPAATVSAHPEELLPPAGYFLMARREGEPVGCGALKIGDDGIGEIKRMWVASSARGLGIGRRLLRALELQAIAAGVDVLRLDTHRRLTEARRMYARSGYTEIAAYNRNPYAHHWFEKRGLSACRHPQPSESRS